MLLMVIAATRTAEVSRAANNDDRSVGLRGLLLGRRFVDDSHDVGLLHDEEFLTVDLDLGARPFAEQNPVTGLDVDGNELARLVTAARPNGDDRSLRRLFFGGIGNDDAAGRLLLGLDALDDNPS